MEEEKENEGDDNSGEEPTVKFEVSTRDVTAAWELVQLSMEAHKCFKVIILLVIN